MKTPILGIYGPSGGGKTTWVCAMIAALRSRGLRIATVKTCHHDPEIEPTRKDSARHLASGADAVLLISPGKKILVERRESRATWPDEIDEFAATVNADLVIVEGARDGLHPKVAVLATNIAWNLDEPFPLIARVGHPPVASTAVDWSEIENAASDIAVWLELRRAAEGVLGLILAGGHGRRLGGVNKSRIERAGVSLASRAAANLNVFVPTSTLCGPDPKRLEGQGLAVLPDAPGAAGPLGGVIAGLDATEKGVLILGVDQIGVTPQLLERILREGMERGAAVAMHGDRLIPTISYMGKSLLEEAREAVSGTRSLASLFDRVGATRVAITEEDAADVDTRADLERYRLSA